MAQFKFSRLARQYLIWTFIFAGTLTISIMLVDVILGLRKTDGDLRKELELVTSTYEPGLAHAIWEFNEPQILGILKGISSSTNIQAVTVNANSRVYSSGSLSNEDMLSRTIHISYSHNGDVHEIGILKAFVDPHPFYTRVREEALLRLGADFIKSIFVLLFSFLVFHLIVSQKLLQIQNWIRENGAFSLGKKLKLYRWKFGYSGNDELDEIVDALWLSSEEISRQIDDLNQKTQELSVSQKREAIGNLSGGMAHDFNNILAAILGTTELLQNTELNHEQMEMAKSIVTMVQRAAELNKNLLAFARKSPLKIKTVDLNHLVDDLLSWVRRTVPTNISICHENNPKLWPVSSDKSMTESSLLNLLVNAQQSMPNGGSIVVQVRNQILKEVMTWRGANDIGPGRFVVLTVRDSGTGISSEIIDKIFDPFFSTKSPAGNSGLGLSVVVGFLEQIGGAVHVTSDPEHGTSFELYFPATESSIESSAVEVKELLPVSAARILLVEDEESLALVLKRQLEIAGHKVEWEKSAIEALARCEEPVEFDLLITDVMMPGGMLGPELAHNLRLVRADLPVIFITGYIHDDSILKGLKLAEETLLIKPIDYETLLNSVSISLSLGQVANGVPTPKNHHG